MARRVFLNWNQSPLGQAARWLIENYRQGSLVDLSQLSAVVPTAIARRALLELLVGECEARALSLLPPALLTVRHLPELLYESQRPLADELTSRMAWQRALSTLADSTLRVLLPQFECDAKQLTSLARLIASVHEDLAANAQDCKRVLQHIALRGDREGARRWEALAGVQESYYGLLKKLGFEDLHAARTEAIHDQRCRAVRPMVLVGLADLNSAMRRMLAQAGDQVTALIFADNQDHDGFDDVGGLVISYWAARLVDAIDDQIVIVDRPHDQALAVLATLAEWDNTVASTPIVGVPDATLVPALERTLQWHGVQTHWQGGIAVRDSLPWQLIRLAAAFVGDPTFPRFAQLVRHPDVFDVISRRLKYNGWLHLVDEFQNEYLPARVERPTANALAASESDAIDFHRIRREVYRLLDSLAPRPQTMVTWGTAFTEMLDRAYAGRRWPEEPREARRLAGALDAWASAMAEVATAEDNFPQPMSVNDFVDVIDDLYGGQTITDVPEPHALELTGWLDLPWSNAESVIVTSMNDDVVPATSAGHPFLPDSLCAELGIEDNQRRWARDVYALNLILQAHRQVKLVCGRRDVAGNPRKPSRLLLATDDQRLLRRARAFFSFGGSTLPRAWLTPGPKGQPTTGFTVPQPADVQPLRTVSVTMFRDYLACPYRFFLKHVLRLQSVSDQLEEMDAGSYGGLAHHVLQDFGQSELRDSTDADEIADYLSAVLDARRGALDLEAKVPSVRIQLENLRKRLRQFAIKQAERRQSGWQIVAVELKIDAPWVVDEHSFTLRGRIDRIDQHDDGRYAVWDYKTSESAKSPNAAHRRRDEWIDLQLPLYRHLLVAWQPDTAAVRDTVVTGYIQLPSLLRDIQFTEAVWTADELASADATAEQVLRRIGASQFWPRATVPPDYSDDFAAICQDHVFGGAAPV